MKVLVTGADGFVGPWLLQALSGVGYQVTAAIRPDGGGARLPGDVETVTLELTDSGSVAGVCRGSYDAVVHLAAVASGGEAQRDPTAAWEVNALGTSRLAEAFGRQRRAGMTDPAFLLVSTAEVYGPATPAPRAETDAPMPCSPYAASKLAAEIAALEVHRRTGLRVVVARAFPHTGPGQDDRFVVPAFARRLIAARDSRASSIKVGNLEPVRELMHVADVVRAYVVLLARGVAGEIYNVASGEGVRLRDLLDRMMDIVGYRVTPERDPALFRAADIPHLVGDPRKLEATTGWRAQIPLEQTLKEVLNAQAN